MLGTPCVREPIFFRKIALIITLQLEMITLNIFVVSSLGLSGRVSGCLIFVVVYLTNCLVTKLKMISER
jgi:hypothetical protein